MKEKIKFILLFILLILGSIKNVKGLELVSTQIDDVWYTRRGGVEGYFSADYRIYSIDGKTTYCIEPGVHITTLEYISNEGLVNSPYSDEINKKIELIGYYGYDYPNHNTLEYRMATQALIWEETGKGIVEFWTKPSGNGNYINIDKEKQEIIKLIDEHYKIPEFSNTTITTTIGKETIITDTNNVLNNFEIINTNEAILKINSNNLSITPSKIGEITITLKRKTYTNNPTTIFVGIDEVSQKMGYFSLSNKQIVTITVKSIGGKVSIQKLDKDNLSIIPQGDATLKGALYGVYTITNEKLGEIAIQDNSTGISDYLPLGKYYLKEEKASTGYTLDDNLYYFEITEENLNPNIKVYEKVIERKFKIYKTLAGNKTEIQVPEANVTFEFYLKNNMKLLTSKTTDENGYLEIDLPYGIYIVKQVTVTHGYEKIQDFEINIDDNSTDDITKIITNSKIKAKLKLIKIDEATKKIISIDGIKFKIKNLDTNEYICQNITYPNESAICIFETKNGTFITPDYLDAGNYQIEELKDQRIDGYIWNKNPLKFSINDHSDFKYDIDFGAYILVYFSNTPVMGEVTIYKYGEKVIFKDNKYYYEDILLDNVYFDLYASDNIYDNDGTLLYKKDDFISSYKTINGFFKIENLFLGDYYLIEKQTVNNHVINSNKHYFNLTYQDQFTEIIVQNLLIKNHLSKGKINFTKKDSISGEFLPNTKIQIYSYENDINNSILIFEGYTDELGKISINDLFIGKYYLIECESPNGYSLNSDKLFFEIKNDKDLIELEMTNDKIIFQIPKTFTNDKLFFNYLSLILFFVGFELIKYAKKDNA